MNKIYMITNFDFKTDVSMKYALKSREIYYNKTDLFDDIKYILKEIQKEYQDITNTNISYNELYTKFKLIIEVSVVNLNNLQTKTEENYKNTLKNNKDNLEEFLLSFLISYKINYDHNLNIKEIYTNTEYDWYSSDLYKFHFGFSYKALYPEKYHVEKYKVGDIVLYNGEKYTICDKINDGSIQDSDDPLNFIYGYRLMTEDKYILQDDKFCYFPVDEDFS